MIQAAASLLVIAWLPGAVLYRFPAWSREKRAALPAEERLFWEVTISLAVSLSIGLAMAAAHRYSFGRLLAADLLVAAGLAVTARFRLRLHGPRPTASSLVVVAIVAMGVWRFFPPAEYVIGGKDPGTYINEGILMAQRGTLVYQDPLISAVPEPVRHLFFASQEHFEHYGTRFMGFFLMDPASGTVVGQFPHLFPASIAFGYGIDGLTGARRTVSVWAILGLVAFYLATARVTGRIVAGAAATLLALHVLEVWFGRYPNAEVAMQALLFAALLANARAHVEGDRFFAPVAAWLLVLLLFLRIDTVLAVASVLAANVLLILRGRRIDPWFVAVVLAGSIAAAAYLAGPMRAYAYYPIQFVLNLRAVHWVLMAAGAALVLAVLFAARRRDEPTGPFERALPVALSAALCGLAVYALFFRHPAGRLALENAYALRMYADFYVTLPAVIAAVIGYALAARTAFWRDPALFFTIAVFSIFFFYKIRIVPEHFWAGRRFLAVILPATLLMACVAAAWGLRQSGWRRMMSGAIGAAFVLLLGSQYVRAARPVMNHVEYAGIIPELEQLAGRVGDDDLLIVESRDAGLDAHVLALPLAYIYARNVVVLGSARPERTAFAGFLAWAQARYDRVLFLGSGGTDLVSKYWTVRPSVSRRFQVPEYESAWNAYPRSVRPKKFDYGLYELEDEQAPAVVGFELDVGVRDDLHVVRFHAKEEAEGHTIRWSQRQSFVSIPALPPGSRELVLVMSAGGRPASAGPADVEVYLNERMLGTIRVLDGFRPYPLPIPPEAAQGAANSDEPARLRLVTRVWNPHEVLGSGDDRELGVMVDGVQVR
jgi:hypothetical protein